MGLEEDNSFQFNDLQRSATNHARSSSDHQTTMEEPDRKRANNSAASIDLGRFYNWPSSRIVRVPRASAGKDRHSKVVTSKGQLRDRRVRLSVNTAIQFYDLQDRLGYDQPSKAVEWLLKAAESSISELPPITDTAFSDTPPKCCQKRSSSPATNGVVSDQLTLEDLDGPVAGGEVGGCNNYLQQRAGNKSCSSASNETTTTTSKGSGLSLSRSEIRVKARERAKERVAEKEKETTSRHIAAGCSFTELLSSGMDNSNNDGSPNSGSGGGALKSPANNWSSASSTATATTTAAMDYFTANMALQMQLASNPITMAAHPVFGENGELLQQFSFVPDHMVVHAANSSNNSHDDQQNGTLNFTISSFNGGTLQSNFSSSSSSSMLWPSLHLPQRFPNIDVISPQSFVITPMDNNNNNVNHHGQQFLSDAAKLQLCYGNPNLHGMHSKGKGKH